MRKLLVVTSVVVTGLIFGCARRTVATKRTENMAENVGAAKSEALPETAVDDNTLRAKLARYVQINIPFDRSKFGKSDLDAVDLLVKASRVLDNLFWLQASDTGPRLRKQLANPVGEHEKLLAHYLAINYGPYDRLDGMLPFMKIPPKPAGASFYPVDMTKDEFKAWIEKHEKDRDAFRSCFTVIRRKNDALVAIPYSSFYGLRLTKAADYLTRAAEQLKNKSLARFLRSRAKAFLSNDYVQSDIDWMDVEGSDIEVTIGPYEVYEDGLFNYKAAFESFITRRDPIQSQKLSRVADYLTEMEKNLPIPEEHKNYDRGRSSPIVVVDLIYSAGDTRAGVQTIAFNLPNDEKVRKLKGSKKVMLKNIARAKFDSILMPIASRVLDSGQYAKVTFDAYFNHTLMHEVSHGLGPGLIVQGGEKVPVNIALGELYSTIEEAKADVLGVYNTLFLISKGALPEKLREQTLVSYLAGSFRSVRFGAHEAHGRANLLIFNYLVAKGAFRYDSKTRRYAVDLSAAPDSFAALAHDLLMLQAQGDYPGTQAFVKKYACFDKRMQSMLDTLHEVPVDIEPIFEAERSSGL
ncbi:MAG TPA: peptidase [Myxococcota bacterium]|nr:peptidase [Myxococcota bacterium]